MKVANVSRCFAVAVVLLLVRAPAYAGFVRSDSNNDGEIDVGDAVYSLLVLFDKIDGFTCDKPADVNDDGRINLSDPIHTLALLFQGGVLPPDPYPECGVDPTEDELWCFESWCEPLELESWYPSSPFGGQVVEHLAFTLEYEEEHEQARWVAYYLTAGHADGPVERSDDYRADPLVETSSAGHLEYRGSGYDRGHLAPAADMRWSETAMSESFYISNMGSQVPGFKGEAREPGAKVGTQARWDSCCCRSSPRRGHGLNRT